MLSTTNIPGSGHGRAMRVSAITDVKFPLIESSTKNLLKLYLNDVGILTGVLYGSNISAVLNDVPSINLGAVLYLPIHFAMFL